MADYKSKLGQVDQSLAQKLSDAERRYSSKLKISFRIKELLAEVDNWKRKYDTDKSSWDAEAKKLNDIIAQKQREIDELKSKDIL